MKSNQSKLIRDLHEHDVLRECLQQKQVEDNDGSKVVLHSSIKIANANALYRFLRDGSSDTVVEIGMAMGASTLVILKALSDRRKGRLISIDPYVGFHRGERVAKRQVERCGWTHLHTHLKVPSFQALAEMSIRQKKVDFVYIDGFHRYDYAFTDAFLADKVLDAGGVIAFNDCGWRSVHGAMNAFFKDNDYEELDVGLPRSFAARNPLFSLIKRVEGRSEWDRYFRKQ